MKHPTTPAETIDAGSISGSQTGTGTETESDHEPSPELVEDELLVEEVSIDGMCGVY